MVYGLAKNSKYSKQEAIDFIIEKYNELGRLPTKKDFERNKWIPSLYIYNRYFGGLQNAFVESGLVKKKLSKEERVNISLQELKQLANKLNKIPTVYEYDNYITYGYQRRNLEQRLGLKWNDICKKYLSEYQLNLCRDAPTKEEVIIELTELKNRLGRTPMKIEINRNNLSFSRRVLLKVFNVATYADVVEELDWNLIGNRTIIRNKEELLGDFLNLFYRLQRIPYFYDINNEPNMASYNTYKKHFGSIENVCCLLNIDYEQYYLGTGAGKIVYDKNNKLCKSIVERDVSNFLIDHNISFEKETYYNTVVKNNSKRFDWEINYKDRTFYVEYFGMYHRKTRGHIGKRYSKRVKKKIKVLYKAGIINNCILIFPNDLKHKSLEEIFSSVLTA